MRLDVAIDQFIWDWRATGRMRSDRTEKDYRLVLYAHADDVENRDPRYTNKDDVKKTLRRWPYPNSQRKNRSILMSFYRWLVEEGYRRDNPVHQTRRPRPVPTNTPRWSREEVVRLLNAVATEREKRAIFLGVFAGLRNSELRGLQGRHFERPGFIYLPPEITKGSKSRVIPIAADLSPVVTEIRRRVARDEYVLPAQRIRDPGINRDLVDRRFLPCSSQALNQLVKRVAKRAGLTGRVYPHLMRHAFAGEIVRHADIRTAQALLGHADLRTTEIYLRQLTPDELEAAVAGFTFGLLTRTDVLGSEKILANPVEAPTGIEPV